MADPITAPAASLAERKRQLVRDELADAADQRQVAIEVEGDARALADPRLIHSAIANLVADCSADEAYALLWERETPY